VVHDAGTELAGMAACTGLAGRAEARPQQGRRMGPRAEEAGLQCLQGGEWVAGWLGWVVETVGWDGWLDGAGLQCLQGGSQED